MNKLTLVGLVAVGLAVAASSAEARGLRRGCDASCAPACAPCPATTVVWQDREVTVNEIQWQEREVTVNVCRLVPREVVEKHTCTIMVPEYTPQKRTITVMTQQARPSVREVCRCVSVPVCVVDPCTGCTRTVCQRQTVREQVPCTVWECVPQQREVTVQVCSYKPVVKNWETKCIVCDRVVTPEKRREKYCVTVPVKKMVKVAVCVPAPCVAPVPCVTVTTCAAPCASACDSGCRRHHGRLCAR
jgi:hypothetical protein